MLADHILVRSGTAHDHDSGSGHDIGAPRFFVYKGRLLFQATTLAQGRELWVSDGAQDGTNILKDIKLGAENSGLSRFVLFKDKVYFVADNRANGYQLWVTDGTLTGTKMVTTSITKNANIVAGEDYIYLFVKDSETKLSIWKSDGTSVGTTIVKGAISLWNEPSNFICVGGLLLLHVSARKDPITREYGERMEQRMDISSECFARWQRRSSGGHITSLTLRRIQR